jgi:agmatine/peptidylarginine deiminase
MKIKTDYDHINELYLVYPEGVKEESNHESHDYSCLTSLYDNLIQKVPSNIKIKLLVKSKAVAEEVRNNRSNMEVMVNSQLTSIWIRDWSGFSTGEKLFKPIFRPQYYWGEYHLADDINQAAYSLHSFMGVDMEELPLVLDGGNFVTNGKVSIITKRIIDDNWSLKGKEKEIEAVLWNKLKIKPIFINEMEGEDTGHADGCIAFLSENDIAVSQYPDSWKEKDRKYVDSLAKLLRNEGFNVRRIIDVPQVPEEEPDGLFVNFLRLNNTILMPAYSHVGADETEKNKNILSEYAEVITLNCDDLAAFGGVLHCISFTN